MTHDHDVLRVVATLAAVALVTAPYWQTIKAAAARGLEAAKAKAGLLSRVAAAALLVVAAWGVVPLPRLPVMPTPAVHVEAPTVELQQIVAPVADAMKNMNHVDRALWVQLWSKAALVVGSPDSSEAVFTDTRSLQMFTGLAVDLAWRRIAGHQPGTNEQLRAAVEAAYAAGIGTDIAPVTPEVRKRYAAFARAMAWAGVGRG